MKSSHYMFCIADESHEPRVFLKKNGKWTDNPREAKWYAYGAHAQYWIIAHKAKNCKVYKVHRDYLLCPVQ